MATECFKATMKSGIFAEYEKKLLQRRAGYGTVSHWPMLTYSNRVLMEVMTDTTV